MESIRLRNSTGNQKIDDILRGFIGIHETVFPGRIRAYHVTGSYANQSALSTSDIDMTLVLRADFVDDHNTEVCSQLHDYLNLVSPVELDVKCQDERELLRLNTTFPYTHFSVINKLGSLLVYGEDIRDSMPLPPIGAVVWTYLEAICSADQTFFTPRRQASEALTFPLTYPDPEGEFYGYDTHRGFALVLHIGLIVTILCAMRAQEYVASKSDCPRLYAEFIGDEWTPFVEEVFAKCRYQWEQRIPQKPADRAQLRKLCQQTLGFEEHFLGICKDFLLGKLLDETGANQLRAAQWLGWIVYPDKAVLNALMSLADGNDSELRQAVSAAIDARKSAYGP